jgi:hypothetical protein
MCPLAGMVGGRLGRGNRGPGALKAGVGLGAVVKGPSLPLGDTEIMGRFDSRSTTKIRQRKAQAKKKAREARVAEATRAARQGK